MTREIKFRSWDGKGMIYFAPYQIGVYDPSGIPNLMQFTGLKDKNGKEIYEGDILVRKANRNFKYKVSWSADLARFSCKIEYLVTGGKFRIGFIALSNKPEKWEVLGNIYENPELLK